MKEYGEDILSSVPSDVPEYAEAYRLRKFLRLLQTYRLIAAAFDLAPARVPRRKLIQILIPYAPTAPHHRPVYGRDGCCRRQCCTRIKGIARLRQPRWASAFAIYTLITTDTPDAIGPYSPLDSGRMDAARHRPNWAVRRVRILATA